MPNDLKDMTERGLGELLKAAILTKNHDLARRVNEESARRAKTDPLYRKR